MPETLRLGENFLKKLGAMMDVTAMEVDQMKDEEMRKEANTFYETSSSSVS